MSLSKKNANIFVLVFFLIPFLFLVNNESLASLHCEVKDSCSVVSNETAVLRVSDTDNAHAELVDILPNYSKKLCCKIDGGVKIGTNCSGKYDAFLKLQQGTNSHVEKVSETNYSKEVCMSVDIGTGISCSYSTSNCVSPAGCVARISGDTNAHVGDCSTSGYTARICCQHNPSALSISADPNPIDSGTPIEVTFTVSSNGVAVRGASVELSNGATGACITDFLGQCRLSINATTSVKATASLKPAYTDGETTITIKPLLFISADYSSVKMNVTTTVTFTVKDSSGAKIDGVSVILNNGDICTTGPPYSSGECEIDIRPSNTNDITAIATLQPTYTDSRLTITVVNFCDGVICEDPPQCYKSPGTCSYSDGLCYYTETLSGVECDDKDACTSGETCSSVLAGVCNGGIVKTCDSPPNDECYDASVPGNCISPTGICSYTPKADGTACDDGNMCTTGEACSAGSCIGGVMVMNCCGNGICEAGEDFENCAYDCGFNANFTPLGIPIDIVSVTMNLTNWILGFISLVAVLVIIFAGVTYITSSGDETKIEKAKSMAKSAVFGLAVAGISYAAVRVIASVVLRG